MMKWRAPNQGRLISVTKLNMDVKVYPVNLTDINPIHWYGVNPIRAGGLNQPALFSDSYFFMKKGVWRSKILWLFLIHYELSENQKKFFWFFTVFWGDLEGAGWFSPPPLSSNIQEPRSIRVKGPFWPNSYMGWNSSIPLLRGMSVWTMLQTMFGWYQRCMKILGEGRWY